MSTKIPTFPPLYKITATDKLYEWTIEIKKNGSFYDIVTTNGEKDGKKVIHSKTVEEGKAKRSVLEQAISESQSKWKNKHEKELYSEDVNTKKSIIVRPMLANKFSFESYDSKKSSRSFKISFPAYIQRKYDGIRCVSYLNDDGEVIIESRSGVPFQNFELLKEQLFDILKKYGKGFYLDGELYTDEIDFEVIAGIIHLHEEHTTEEDLKNINLIKYFVYDIFDTSNPEMPYSARLDLIKTIFSNLKAKKDQLIVEVPTYLAKEPSDVKTYHDEFVEEGFEGVMVRDKAGPYEPDKRSKYLQKYKEIMEEEFKIIGYHDGVGKCKGTVVWTCEIEKGKTVDVTPKGTLEYRKKLFESADKYIGKKLTVIFFGYTADGSLRFPIGKAIRENY